MLDSLARFWAEEGVYPEPYLLPRDAALSCTSVESQRQEDGSWSFTAPVTGTNRDGQTMEFTVSGTAWFDREGKFTDVQIADAESLRGLLEGDFFTF